MARVSYVEKEQASDDIRRIYEKMEAGGFQVLNLYKAVAHSPQIGLDVLKLGNKILYQGRLSPKLRELAILQVGLVANAPYEFTKHKAIGLKSGLSQAQLDALRSWRHCELFDEQERAVLAFAESCSRAYRVSDEAFAAVRAFLDEEQVVELTVVIGYYELICRLLETLQVELEDYEFQSIGRAE